MRFLLLLLLCFIATATNAEDSHDRQPGAEQPVFLVPDEAFGFDVAVRDAHTLQASFNVSPGYYMYRDKISFLIEDGAARIMAAILPKGEMTHDPYYGDMEVLRHSFVVDITLNRARLAATNITLHAFYQGCSEGGLCYLPIDKTKRLALPVAKSDVSAPANLTPSPALSPTAIQSQPVTENSRIANLFKVGDFWLIVSFFFGAGLLLSLTPCAFPMIPILSGIIVRRGNKITQAHAFFLSLAFVMGMAITYAVAGVIAGYSGNLLSSALQTPWILGSFAGLFVLLSLSMFGLYELQLPSAWQSKLSETSNRLHGGHLSGTFVMGALSAIIMGPCVTAPLAGALLYISQTHDAILGGVALFVLALGMGAPLLLIGSSAGVLLPKAGAWMIAVKRLFGVLLLAMAIWTIQSLLPISVQMLLWASLLILSAVFLRLQNTLPHNTGGRRKFIVGFGRSAGALLGIAYLIGALSGARDILHPLSAISAASPAALQFTHIKNIAELDQRLTQAHGQPVMLDFYADWCISCKEMERNTFSDPGVQAKLKPILLLQADVSANSEADRALLKRYGLYGPPGILFFDSQGKEISDQRVMGYQDAAHFLQSTEDSCGFITVC
jgi:thiol:disulfide interchange protein DsbD